MGVKIVLLLRAKQLCIRWKFDIDDVYRNKNIAWWRHIGGCAGNVNCCLNIVFVRWFEFELHFFLYSKTMGKTSRIWPLVLIGSLNIWMGNVALIIVLYSSGHALDLGLLLWEISTGNNPLLFCCGNFHMGQDRDNSDTVLKVDYKIYIIP